MLDTSCRSSVYRYTFKSLAKPQFFFPGRGGEWASNSCNFIPFFALRELLDYHAYVPIHVTSSLFNNYIFVLCIYFSVLGTDNKWNLAIVGLSTTLLIKWCINSHFFLLPLTSLCSSVLKFRIRFSWSKTCWIKSMRWLLVVEWLLPSLKCSKTWRYATCSVCYI